MSVSVKNFKIIGLVLARKNSRRLKNKNIKKLGGKRLINITLDNLTKIKHLFNHIIVSSDSKIIENCTKKKGFLFFKRSKKLSLGRITSGEVAIDIVKKYEKSFGNIDYIILFQVTSPFRKNSTIKKFIKFLKKYPKHQIVTVNNKEERKPNGVLYLTPKDILFKYKSFTSKNFKKFTIKTRKESLDIDTIHDFNLAQNYLKKNIKKVKKKFLY